MYENAYRRFITDFNIPRFGGPAMKNIPLFQSSHYTISADEIIKSIRSDGILRTSVKGSDELGIKRLNKALRQYWWGFPWNPDEDFVEIKWIEPSRITDRLTLSDALFPTAGENAITGVGSKGWDTYTEPFKEYIVYDSLKSRFDNGLNWKKTKLYQRKLRQLSQTGTAWNGCKSVDELDKRCKYLEELYHKIKTDGYLSQYEIAEQYETEPKEFLIGNKIFPAEIRVAVGRNNNFIRVGDDRHRLSIAKILNIELIPVVVMAAHKDSNYCP